MIRITDPQGPDAARSMLSGMFVVAELKGYAPDVILSANCSSMVVMAKELPQSREAIANALRAVLQMIESGEFPSGDQAIVQAHVAGSKLH